MKSKVKNFHWLYSVPMISESIDINIKFKRDVHTHLITFIIIV